MQFLIDEGVDVRVVGVLKRLGHDALRVPSGAINGAVIRLAQREQRILVTRDSDFSDTILYPPQQYFGIIHLAIHPPWIENIIPPLTKLLKSVSENKFKGKVFILESTGYRRIP